MAVRAFKNPVILRLQKRTTYGFPVVTMQSATALCTKALDPIDSDHIEIVKPADLHAESYLAFKVAYIHEMKQIPESRTRADLQSFISVLHERADIFTSALDNVITFPNGKASTIRPRPFLHKEHRES